MNIKTVHAVYFSGTGTTEKVVTTLAKDLAERLGAGYEACCFNLPEARKQALSFGPEDLAVVGTPVYAGRVPNLLLPYIRDMIHGEGTLAVPVVLYGNRNYDDGLMELRNVLRDNGFCPVAAGAFVGEHSFSKILGAGRPDADDLAVAAQFGHDVAALIEQGATETPAIKGNRPYRDGMPDTGARPATTDACTKCGICVKLCPMGIIDADDPAQVADGCLQCNACVKGCPQDAKRFEGEQAAAIVAMLEGNCLERKEPELFL